MIESDTEIKHPDSFLYESLRFQSLEKDKNHSKGTLGLAMFLRQGMFSWTNACHQYAPESTSVEIQINQLPILPIDVQSEMTKVLANITFFNIEESA
jgi:hypothetical protein